MPWGWLKRGEHARMNDVDGAGIGLSTSTVRNTTMYPKFGALRRNNTPTPACLLYINEIMTYNNCSWSCIRGRRDRPWAWFSPASLLVVMAGSKCNGCRPSRRRGTPGSYSVSLGYYGNLTR